MKNTEKFKNQIVVSFGCNYHCYTSQFWQKHIGQIQITLFYILQYNYKTKTGSSIYSRIYRLTASCYKLIISFPEPAFFHLDCHLVQRNC